MPPPAPYDLEVPQPFCALDEPRRFRAPIDLRDPLQLEEVARLEVDKEQRRARFAQHVAERVVVAVAGKIGNGETVSVNVHKTGAAAAMRNVDSASGADFRSRPARDE